MKMQGHELIQKLQQNAYDDGFREGWNTAVERMNEVAKELPISAARGNPFRRGSGQAKVYDYIRDHPGLLGRDIIASVNVSPKIVRNTLQRLKEKNLAAASDDGWKISVQPNNQWKP